MAKSSDAFRTIGEVSEELEVPKHVLRFWEGKFPQLKPMKRGGGRRFYRPEDVVLLRGIKQLLHSSGYTIRGVQRILREEGIDAVKTLIANGPPPASSQDGTPAKSARAPIVLPKALRTTLLEISRELNSCLALARGTPAPPATRKSPAHAKSRKAS